MKRALAIRIGLLFGTFLFWDCGGASHARADDWTWTTATNASNYNWSTSTGWYSADDSGGNYYAPNNDGTADVIFPYQQIVGFPLSQTSPNSNVDMNWAINSLHFVGTLAYNIFGSQLTIGAGGIVTNNTSSGITINTPILLAAPQSWIATATTTMTVGGTVNINSQKMTLDGGGAVNFNGPITGTGQMILNGSGNVTFGGGAGNTFSSPMQVNTGILFLNKPNAINAVPGNLTIGSGSGQGATVWLESPNQIADTATVTINSNGELFIPNGTQEYIPRLVLNGGAVFTDTGPGCFLGFINNSGQVTTVPNSNTAFISGVLNLNDDSTHTTTFNIQSGTTPEGIDLWITASLVAGGITKGGAGSLLLTGNNTFAGGFNLNAGTLLLGSDTAGNSGSITSGPVGTGVLYMADQTIIEASGNHTVANFISIPTTGTSGIIDGPSNLTLTGGLTGNGSLVKNGTGTLTFNAATSRAIGGGLTVNNGSVVLNTGSPPNGLTINGNLAVGAVSGQAAALSVNNASFVQNGATNVIVGATGSGAATVNVGTTANGTLTVGSGGLVINPTGSVLVGSGTTSGTLDMNTHAGNITINGGSLEIDGGSVTFPFATTSSVHIENGGTLTTAVSIPTAIYGDGTTSTINVTANNVTLGTSNGLNFIGFTTQGTLNINTHTVTLASNSYAQLGAFTYLNGGTINASNGISLPSGSWLVGGGRINGRVVGEPGAIASVSLGRTLELGDSTSPAGFNYGGELRMLAGGTMTLDSSGPATVGNLTTLDSGTLNAANGFVLNFGDAITGNGTVNSSNTLALHSVVNGIVQGISPSQPITLSGWIKGTGMLNNVSFAPGATYDPGFSPATVNVGNIAFSSGSTLNIDIGGTTPGSQYDQIISSGTPTLAGTLSLSPYGGFVPVAGDKFIVMTYPGATGTFSSITGTSPAPGLSYSVIYEPTALVVLATANGCQTWGVDSDGSLSTGSNYVGSTAPNGVGAVATFSNIITANRTVTLDADTTLGTLNFDSPFNYTLSGPHKLTMQAAGSAAAQINVSAAHGSGSHTISASMGMASDLSITQMSDKPLNITGGLQNPLGKVMSTSGTGEVSVSGPVNLGPGSQLAVKGNSTLKIGLQAGQQATVGTAVQAQVSDNATLELAGSVSGLADSAAASLQNRADIKNNSSAQKGVHVTGTNQVVGGIDGTGTTAVEPGADLKANHIVQGALVIGGNAGSPGKATIAPSDPLGRPMDIALVMPASVAMADFLPATEPFALDSPGLASPNSPTVLSAAGDSSPAAVPAASASLANSSAVVPEPSAFLLVSLGGTLAALASQRFRTGRRGCRRRTNRPA